MFVSAHWSPLSLLVTKRNDVISYVWSEQETFEEAPLKNYAQNTKLLLCTLDFVLTEASFSDIFIHGSGKKANYVSLTKIYLCSAYIGVCLFT